jgi:uncharacterized protein YndB with AHSA1/START domain
MSQLPVVHSTFTLERVYRASAERVFAAFSDPAKKRRWFAEGSKATDLESYALDFRVGGTERAEFRFTAASPFPGDTLTNTGNILDIVESQRIVTSSTMSMSGRCFSASLMTAEIFATEDGAKLVLTHQNAFFEGADGTQMREQGWRDLLDKLAKELA